MKILECRDLNISFKDDDRVFHAVNNISFDLEEGEILGIVGESGSGKSVAVSAITNLIARNSCINSGEILFLGRDILKLKEKEVEIIRGASIANIYQDPQASLNPVYTIEKQIIEGMLIHKKIPKKKALDIALNMLLKVGINDAKKVMKSYPSELSGGMRQRVIIAMALCMEPKILIADEITTALDVTIQAQILEIIKNIREEFKMSIIIITHDLGVIAEICDRVIVMYGGKIIEEANVFDLFDYPKHPYTKALLKARPIFEDDNIKGKELAFIKGQPLDNSKLPKGCYFYDRCEFKMDVCLDIEPKIKTKNNHKVLCNLYNEEKI